MPILPLLRHKFLRDTATLQIGSVLNAIGSFLSAVALAHLLGAHEQGRFYVAISLYSLVWLLLLGQGLVGATVSQVAAASVRGLVPKTAAWLAFLAKAHVLLGLVLLGLGGLLFPLLADRFLDDPHGPGWWAWWLALTPLLELPRVVVCAALQGTRRMLPLAQIENAHEFARVLLVVVGALVTNSAAGAILGTLAASVIGSIVGIELYRSARRETPEGLPSLRDIARQVRGVPLAHGFPLGIKLGLVRSIDALATRVLPTLILKGVGGSNEWVAYLRIAQSIMNVPLLFMQGISRTALPVLSEHAGLRDVERFRRAFAKAVLYSGAFISAGILIALPLVPWIVGAMFPDSYQDPIWTICLILLPGLLILSFSIANDTFYLVTDTLKAGVILCTVGLFVNAGVVAVCAWLDPTTGVAWGISFTLATSTMHYVYAFLWFRRHRGEIPPRAPAG